MLEKRSLKNSEVLKLKSDLLARDRENKLGSHFKVAVLEFQKIASRLKSKDRAEKALKPLFDYMHRFGKKDPENLWRAEMMVAEFLFAKNSIPQALEHAQASYQAAPESIKFQIAETITFMTKRNQ
jgi:predicted Zn-dependent protease